MQNTEKEVAYIHGFSCKYASFFLIAFSFIYLLYALVFAYVSSIVFTLILFKI